MKVGELIKRLQELKLDPELDVLVEAPDYGEPYAVSYICEDEYVSSYDKKPKPVQVALIRLSI